MRKGIVFYYELRRLLLAREYLLLLAATLVFSMSLLRSVVIFGIRYTAPFSMLTFGSYCISLLPFLFTLLLVLCIRQSKASECGAKAIISATPIPQHVFLLLRYGAIACAFLITVVLPVAACFLFYRLVFNYVTVGALLVLALLILLPPAFLLFGIAMLFASKKAKVGYVLLVSVFRIPLPEFINIIGSSENFELTSEFITGRIVVMGIGVVLILASLFPLKNKKFRYWRN